MDNLSNNLFYTHNTSKSVTEVVYYTGAVGIVFNKEKFDAGKEGASGSSAQHARFLLYLAACNTYTLLVWRTVRICHGQASQ